MSFNLIIFSCPVLALVFGGDTTLYELNNIFDKPKGIKRNPKRPHGKPD